MPYPPPPPPSCVSIASPVACRVYISTDIDYCYDVVPVTEKESGLYGVKYSHNTVIRFGLDSNPTGGVFKADTILAHAHQLLGSFSKTHIKAPFGAVAREPHSKEEIYKFLIDPARHVVETNLDHVQQEFQDRPGNKTKLLVPLKKLEFALLVGEEVVARYRLSGKDWVQKARGTLWSDGEDVIIIEKGNRCHLSIAEDLVGVDWDVQKANAGPEERGDYGEDKAGLEDIAASSS